MAGDGRPVPPLDELAAYLPSGATEVADARRVAALLREPDPWSRAIPLHLTASALIVHPPTRRVLLRWHERQRAWLQVGGHADPGENDPLAVALREAVEETGLTDVRPWPDASVRHLAVVAVPASATEPAHEHADVRFVLATAHPGAAVPERASAPLRWLTVPEAEGLVTEPNLRETLARVAGLLAAA